VLVSAVRDVAALRQLVALALGLGLPASARPFAGGAAGTPAEAAPAHTLPIADPVGRADGIDWHFVVPPLALLDPRTGIGALVLFAVGLGVLLFALAAAPRQAYAGIGIRGKSVIDARVTLSLAGAALMSAVAITQFLN
jgi:hypothetical protein